MINSSLQFNGTFLIIFLLIVFLVAFIFLVYSLLNRNVNNNKIDRFKPVDFSKNIIETKTLDNNFKIISYDNFKKVIILRHDVEFLNSSLKKSYNRLTKCYDFSSNVFISDVFNSFFLDRNFGNGTNFEHFLLKYFFDVDEQLETNLKTIQDDKDFKFSFLEEFFLMLNEEVPVYYDFPFFNDLDTFLDYVKSLDDFFDDFFFKNYHDGDLNVDVLRFLDERLKEMVLHTINNIIKNIVLILSEPHTKNLKVFSMFEKLNITDSKGGQIYVSPYYSEFKGWFIYSSEGVILKNKIESRKNDIADYLGYNVNFSYDGDYLLMGKGSLSDIKTPSFPEKLIWSKDKLDPNFVCVGIDENLQPRGRQFLEDKHLLIVGISGFGKSVLQNFIINQVLQREEAFMYLVDLKNGIEFSRYRKKERCKVVANVESLGEVLGELVSIINKRSAEMVEKEILTYDGTKIYLVIDEFSQISYFDDAGIKEDKAMINRVKSNLNKVSTLGRAVGIRLICGLQKSTTAEMSSGFKNNLHDRILMKTNNSLAFSEVFGVSSFGDDVEIKKPSTLRPGEMLYLQDGAEYPVMLKCPYIE